MPLHPYGTRLATWKRLTEWPMVIASVVFLGAFAFSVIQNLRPPDDAVAEAVMWVVWVLFAIEYIVSLSLATRRRRWFVRHLHELAIVALPLFRPLRLLRLVSLISTLQRAAGSALRERVTIYLVATSTLLVLVSALAVLDAEQNAEGSNIHSFGDAIWWAFVTITTVGYGDFYPVTAPGRLTAVGLMIAGIALLGSVTATFASWFVERIQQGAVDDQETPDTPTR